MHLDLSLHPSRGTCSKRDRRDKSMTFFGRPHDDRVALTLLRYCVILMKVLAVQEDIVDSQPHLKEAAIPVQDLHLTLFVATLHEQDGSLQVDT